MPSTRKPLDERISVIGRLWVRWLKVASVIGTVQMVVLLTILYWLFVPLLAIPFGVVADPLRSRRGRRRLWVSRTKAHRGLDWMRRQG